MWHQSLLSRHEPEVALTMPAHTHHARNTIHYVWYWRGWSGRMCSIFHCFHRIDLNSTMCTTSIQLPVVKGWKEMNKFFRYFRSFAPIAAVVDNGMGNVCWPPRTGGEIIILSIERLTNLVGASMHCLWWIEYTPEVHAIHWGSFWANGNRADSKLSPAFRLTHRICQRKYLLTYSICLILCRARDNYITISSCRAFLFAFTFVAIERNSVCVRAHEH